MVLVPLGAGLAVAPVIARHIPETYRSETLIMVIPQQIPDSYVKSIVTATVEGRLPSINEQILSRSRLERIIGDLGLYHELRARRTMEEVVQKMRADIDVKIEGKELFRVSYVSLDPHTAQQVTERLASLYIEENLRDRENLTESTNQFLESQLEEAKRRLIEHEKKLEEYRRRYAGQLPSQLPSNLQSIQNAQLQLQALNEAMNRVRERRLLVERQLADARTLPADGQTYPPAGAQDAVPLTTAQQLDAAQARLAQYRLRYTADHPDVRTAERTVRDLQAKLQEEARNPAPEQPRLVSPAEAARLKQISDLRAELEVIDHQLAANQAEETRLKGVIADYQGKVDVVPTRESELVELTRDYSTLQATYASLLAKREESKLAANLERRQIGEQFKVLDPASLPEKPYNRWQRLTLSGSAAFLGLFLGIGAVVLLEFGNSSFRSEEEVQRVLGLPVLALVPMLVSDNERRTKRRRWLQAVVAVAVVAIGTAAAVIAWGLRS